MRALTDARRAPDNRPSRAPGRFTLRIATCACVVLSALALLILASARGQAIDDPELRKQLAQLFPAAASFTPKEGNPPHYKAFGPAGEGAAPELLGYAYWTTELEPLERAYDGPIKMLVGMDPRGKLTGILWVRISAR
jgi:NosR/NirI family nitrous oxide reductase transcriptional regulator